MKFNKFLENSDGHQRNGKATYAGVLRERPANTMLWWWNGRPQLDLMS